MRTKVATDLLSPLRSHGALRPGGGRASGVAFLGRATPYTIFRRALGRGNLMGAEATAKELPWLGLADALELTLLIARKDPRRHPRLAARWLLRYLEEDDEATIDELALAASCLAALTGNGYPEAAQALRDMAEKATRRRRGRSLG
jgi:hypothetical protein